MLLLLTALVLLVGTAVGLLGGGGSVLTLPLLVHVGGQSMHEAVVGSLAVVAAASGVGALTHWRAGNLDGRLALSVGGGGVLGAILGARLSHLVPETWLGYAFATVMLITALAMLRPRCAEPSGGTTSPEEAFAWGQALRLGLVGIVTGLLAGFLGAGGGFLVVPALVLVGQVGMRRAVGTSLAIITVQAVTGFISHADTLPTETALIPTLAAAAAVGAFLGARWSHRVDPSTLRSAFGVLILGVALFEIWSQTSIVFAAAAAAVAFLLVGPLRSRSLLRPWTSSPTQLPSSAAR